MKKTLIRLPESNCILSIIQESINFFSKGLVIKYVRVCRPYISCYHHYPTAWWCESRHWHYINSQAWLCSNKTLFAQVGGRPQLADPSVVFQREHREKLESKGSGPDFTNYLFCTMCRPLKLYQVPTSQVCYDNSMNYELQLLDETFESQ